jgi:hypothetical protein
MTIRSSLITLVITAQALLAADPLDLVELDTAALAVV